MTFELTEKQREARRLLGGKPLHNMLFGGSRSGKTFLGCYATAFRASIAPKSRHAIVRFRLNAVEVSVGYDTMPKVLGLAWPGLTWRYDKKDHFFEFENGAQIWLLGLDDKDRTEKVLGMEFATVYLNECSQIPWGSRNIVLTRLAQQTQFRVDNREGVLRLKAIYDCNPPSQAHWTYKVFIQKVDPETKQALPDPENYASLQMNPGDNRDNLAPEYLASLEAMPARMRLRFLEGKFSDITSNALWKLEDIEKWRASGELPDMQRIVIALDPSGAGDADGSDHDPIGVIVAGLGSDGNGYVLEDITVKAGPSVWGNVAVNAYERWNADLIVAETNFGGAMVESVIDAAARAAGSRKPPYRAVNATRGKVVRAEPISTLAEQGKIRHAGRFPELEDELCAFTPAGYLGDQSPNRADAYVWAFTELFPGIAREKKAVRGPSAPNMGVSPMMSGPGGWMR